MINQEQYINLNKESVNSIIQFTDCNKTALFLFINLTSTYKFKIFGIYKNFTYTSLLNNVNSIAKKELFRDVTHIKKAVKQLEKKNLLKIVVDKNELILSLEEKISDLDSLKKIVENNASSFNLSSKRILELSKSININASVKIESQILSDDFYFDAEK
jgi:hypothetical protein